MKESSHQPQQDDLDWDTWSEYLVWEAEHPGSNLTYEEWAWYHLDDGSGPPPESLMADFLPHAKPGPDRDPLDNFSGFESAECPVCHGPAQLKNDRRRWRCIAEVPCTNEGWDSVSRSGFKEHFPAPTKPKKKRKAADPSTEDHDPDDEPFARPLASYGVLRALFTFSNRIQLAAVNLLVGIGGMNKSTLLAKIAADATQGLLDGDLAGKRINVLIASAEDGIETVMHPRLIAAGADVKRVHILNKAITLPEDVDKLAEYVEEHNIGLVIIDPLVEYLDGGVDSHKDADVRRALKVLQPIAEEQGMTTLTTIHLNKTRASDIYTRISGSTGFFNLSRSVMAMTQDPRDEGDRMARVLWHEKVNAGELQRPQAVSIEPVTVRGDQEPVPTIKLELGEYIDRLTINQALESPDARKAAPRREQAEAILIEVLANGPVEAEEMFGVFEGSGIHRNTVYAAAKNLGVVQEPDRNDDGTYGKWFWRMPDLKIKVNLDGDEA